MSRAVETPPPPNDPKTEPTIVQLNDEMSNTTTELSRTKENIIETPSGQVKVRPYRSSSNAQLKAVLSFTPRVSSLDRHNVKSQSDEFRGFFVLFWIGTSFLNSVYLSALITGLGLLFIQTSLRSWETNRTPLSWKFGKLITGDALVLALADGLMTIGQFFCVPFVKGLIARGYKYYWAGLVIQHTYQTFYLGVAIWIGVHRQWYWVQAGFLVLRESVGSDIRSELISSRLSIELDEGILATPHPRKVRLTIRCTRTWPITVCWQLSTSDSNKKRSISKTHSLMLPVGVEP
jgi:sterol O-acyltransferase